MLDNAATETNHRNRSIGRRFSYALIGVITLLLALYAAVVIVFDINRLEREMEKRLGNAILVAQNSLPLPLWNLDYVVVSDFVDALFLDETVVYTKIWWNNQIIVEKRRSGFSVTRRLNS